MQTRGDAITLAASISVLDEHVNEVVFGGRWCLSQKVLPVCWLGCHGLSAHAGPFKVLFILRPYQSQKNRNIDIMILMICGSVMIPQSQAKE
jgi:hypothetical protein